MSDLALGFSFIVTCMLESFLFLDLACSVGTTSHFIKVINHHINAGEHNHHYQSPLQSNGRSLPQPPQSGIAVLQLRVHSP